MDDPIGEAFVVVEEVTNKIVDRFGEEGKKCIDPNRLFVTAEYHLTNGFTKEDAITTMLASAVGEGIKKMGNQLKLEKQDVNNQTINDSIVSLDKSNYSLSPDFFEEDN